ncbi:MAG: insulinase family protein [Erysipelotrichaceae bacterium]
MQTNQIYHGFKLVEMIEVAELKATAFYFVYEKTKTPLFYLQRDDDNKSFAIGFKTVPTDSTGVFHILEHSVLNGSKKYPLKEPFVDLLKGSLQTFLNAMTYPDKTVYPISSRNEKDFLNLVDVYLDGVFNPNCLSNPNIFYQEGIRYQYDQTTGELQYNGVVYSEMKGAFSSAERLADQYLSQYLFPDTTYGYCSGGDPDEIVNLTYQQFCQYYEKYYHPSNAMIFVDGKLDIERLLQLIDENYLGNYQYKDSDIKIAYQKPQVNEKVVKYYQPVDGIYENRTIINFGYVISSFDEYDKITAYNIIAKVLADTNESVLVKALVSGKLAQNVEVSVVDELLQPYLCITVYNCAENDYDKIKAVIDKVLNEVVNKGIDQKLVKAIISNMEFSALERDFSKVPAGIIYSLIAINCMNYGGNPLDGLVYNDMYQRLRELVNSDYYIDLIKDGLINSKHFASVILKPQKGYNELLQQKRRAKLQQYKDALNQEQLASLIKMNEEFALWQSKSDTLEDKKCLPKLDISDIDPKAQYIEKEVIEYQGTTLITYPAKNENITYVNELYQIDDLSNEELALLSLLIALIGELDCQKMSLQQFLTDKYAYLGSFSLSTNIFNSYHNSDSKIMLICKYSYLNKNEDNVLFMLDQLLNHTLFEDIDAIREILVQIKSDMQQAIVSSGQQFALSRALSALSGDKVAADFISGYSYYQTILQIMQLDDSQLQKQLQDLYCKVFDRNRLTLSLSALDNQTLAAKICLQRYCKNAIGPKAERTLNGFENEAIEIKGQVSFAAMVADTNAVTADFLGQFSVIARIISLDYLWNEIRAKCNAYGCGLSIKKDSLAYYSYRDPNPANSFEVYNSTIDYLKQLLTLDVNLDSYIIGAIGNSEPILTAKSSISIGNREYLCGIDYQDKCQFKNQILSFSRSDIAEAIERLMKIQHYKICLVGPKQAIEQCSNIETVNTL